MEWNYFKMSIPREVPIAMVHLGKLLYLYIVGITLAILTFCLEAAISKRKARMLTKDI